MIFRVEKKSLDRGARKDRTIETFSLRTRANVSEREYDYSNDGGKKKRRVVEVNSSLTFD